MNRVLPIMEIVRGFWSLLQGMQVTIKEFFHPVVTVRYPYETLPIPPRYRGHIEMLKDATHGQPVCTGCKLCEKGCPSGCIKVNAVKSEELKRRVASEYSLDFTKCSLCGACVEVCPVDAIRFSKAYNLASTQRADYQYDLLKNMKVKDS